MTPEQAYGKVRTAIKNGVLVRPDECSKCGKTPPRGSDGRVCIHAHHHVGYDKPLDVEWLCAKCHRDETPLPPVIGAPTPGERNGAAKLTEAAVIYIRTSGEMRKDLAKRFGVRLGTITDVRLGRWWKHVVVPARPLMEGDL